MEFRIATTDDWMAAAAATPAPTFVVIEDTAAADNNAPVTLPAVTGAVVHAPCKDDEDLAEEDDERGDYADGAWTIETVMSKCPNVTSLTVVCEYVNDPVAHSFICCTDGLSFPAVTKFEWNDACATGGGCGWQDGNWHHFMTEAACARLSAVFPSLETLVLPWAAVRCRPDEKSALLALKRACPTLRTLIVDSVTPNMSAWVAAREASAIVPRVLY